MPKPGIRSKSKRSIQRKLPGGKTVKHYKGKTKGKAICANCGKQLHGIPTNAAKMPKSVKTVNRPYGGHYCSKCTRAKIIELNTSRQ